MNIKRARFVAAVAFGAMLALCPKAARATDAEDRSKACEALCKPERTICLDAVTGEPFCKGASDKEKNYGKVPNEVLAGDELTLLCVGPTGMDCIVTTSTARRRDVLVASFPGDKPQKLDAPKGEAKPQYAVLFTNKHVVPDDEAAESVTISLQGKVRKDYTIAINHGKYYIEVGVLLPFVYNGSRKVTGAPIPGTGGDQTLTVKETWQITPALVINVFPGGRSRGKITSFEIGNVCRSLANLLGIQAGIDLDLSRPFDRFYVGGVFAPVTGLSLNAGLALLEGEFIPKNYRNGLLLPQGESFTPDIKFMPRFYFGLTATLDLLTTLSRGFTAAKGISFK